MKTKSSFSSTSISAIGNDESLRQGFSYLFFEGGGDKNKEIISIIDVDIRKAVHDIKLMKHDVVGGGRLF